MMMPCGTVSMARCSNCTLLSSRLRSLTSHAITPDRPLAAFEQREFHDQPRGFARVGKTADSSASIGALRLRHSRSLVR